jgi:pimeloyl-ACP methyl ester carboxylesterase
MPLHDTRYAGLAATERRGTDPGSPAFVFLHGLTFDRRMWEPILAELPPAHRAIAFDLPGHGGSPSLDARGLAAVADAVHAAVEASGMRGPPAVVGHSIGGPLASIYAAMHPAAGAVSIDAPIRLEPLAEMLRAAAPRLRGAGFGGLWSDLRDGWLMDAVAAPHRELLRPADRPDREVVLRYQADILERPLEDVVEWRDEGMAAFAESGIPYLCLLANEPDPQDVAWLAKRIPQAEVVVWPVEHHFPHLARPALFADLLGELVRRVAVPG